MSALRNELAYIVRTYPLLYGLWGLVLISWLYALGRLVHGLRHKRPIRRADRPLLRFALMLRDSIGQLPIMRLRLAGLMHLGLFAGGFLLLAAYVASHWLYPRGQPWQNAAWVHTVNDLGMVLALAGLVLAAWRRQVRRELPAHWTDVTLWGLLTAGTLLALLSNVLLVAIAKPTWREQAWVSNALARLFASLPVVTLRALYGWSWSVLHGLVWCSALLLPWVKWRHVLLTPLSLFSQRLGPPARMDPLSLEGDGPYGACRPCDLTWKQVLDTVSCTRCGRCARACPAHIAGTALDPLDIVDRLQDVDDRSPLAQQVGDVVHSASPVAAAQTNVNPVWDCTTCMACEQVCPAGISPLSMVLDLRRERVLDAAAFPRPLERLFRGLEQQSNPWGLPRGERERWSRSLGLPELAPGASCETLLWLGCMGSYDERARKAVLALVRLLHSAGVSVATLGAAEGCCGDPARRTGNEYLWRELAARNIEALRARHFQRLVTLCPHCANALAVEYADLGCALPAVHATVYLAELLRAGRLSLGASRTAGETLRLTYHDPCYLGRGSGLARPARALIRSLPQVQFVELGRRGRDALCCGAGGGQMWLGEDGHHLEAARVQEVLRSASAVCATACPYCASMLADGLAGTHSETSVRDIVELLADCLPQDPPPGRPNRSYLS